MNRVPFGEGACGMTRKYLDSYISNELLVETSHEVLRHLESCPACAAESEARMQLRMRLKSAVQSQSVPPELQVRILERIEAGHTTGWFAAGWMRWAGAGAMAAALVVASGVWLQPRREVMPALADRAAQNSYIQRVSSSVASVLKVGLGDHIHCSVFRKYPQNPPPVQQMVADLGPAYEGLLGVMRAAIPSGYRIVMAHQCSYAKRKYVHVTLEKDGELLSLVIARKNEGESLAGLPPASHHSEIPIYQSAADRYQVAGFDAGNFLVYVVSDLRGKENLQIAASLAPGVREFLIKTA